MTNGYSLAVVVGVLVLGAAPAAAQEREEAVDPERRAQLMRQGAGLRLGAWWVQDREDEARVSRWPYMEGYFQRGLDLHLALESTLSVWRQRRPLDGGGRVDSYAVPLFTSLKFYPTRPESALEPFVLAGLGLALGIEDRAGEGLLGPTGGTSVTTGFGLRGGTGLEWRFGRAFGLHLAVAYNWLRFSDRLDGEDGYRGPVATGGLVYRFQF